MGVAWRKGGRLPTEDVGCTRRQRTKTNTRGIEMVAVGSCVECFGGNTRGILCAYGPGARRARPMPGSKVGLGEARPGQAARTGQSL